MNNIILFLMNEKGYFVLKNLTQYGMSKSIRYVVTAEDKGMLIDFSKDIRELCNVFNIAVGWRWIINDENLKLIVLHDSLLPKYRGFSPLVNMLINGEKEIGVTALIAEKDYDSGDIILQKSCNVTYPITIQEAIDKIKVLYFEIVEKLLEQALSKKSYAW